jgi:hypothetical protein
MTTEAARDQPWDCALMVLHEARRATRVDAAGYLILLKTRTRRYAITVGSPTPRA